GLRWSVRVNALTAGKPVGLRPAPDGRGVVVTPKTADPFAFDVRVEHRDRMGRTRTLQCDGLSCPAAAQTFLTIDTNQLGSPNAKPLHVSVAATDQQAPIAALDLGERLTTPVVRLPARMIGPAAGSDLKQKHAVELDMQATIQANAGRTVRLSARGEVVAA